MPIITKRPKSLSPARLLVVGFAAVILLGTALLMLPFATREGMELTLLEALFTVTASVCVTGMALFDIYTHFTGFGQFVIMALIQLGGLGLLTFVTMFNMMLGKKVGFRHAAELADNTNVTDNTANLFRNVRGIVVYAFVIEQIGAVIFAAMFVPRHGLYGLFMAEFMAVSGFCNSGLDLLGKESVAAPYANYMTNHAFQITLMLLIVAGGLGYMVWHNLFRYRSLKKLTLHTKLVLYSSAGLILGGALIYGVIVYAEPAFAGLSHGEKIYSAFFTSVSARTAGFAGVGVATGSEAAEIFTMILMFIGGAPGSTAGGIKVTTLVIIFATVASVVRGRADATVLGHSVKKDAVYKALTVLALSLVFIIGAFTAVYVINGKGGAVQTLFDVTSAFSTAGFSSGVYAQANTLSKLIFILTMFVGRIGPVSLLFSLSWGKSRDANMVMPEATIMVG